ncbi:MAG: hypothetical protein OXI82_02520 [Nitrospinae bacterium]|nr:hypothetical protein [Nitrospinota bacterium]
MPENYDQRRSRCMLDQSSNTQNPIHLILRSPYALKTEYAGEHEEVRALLDAFNALAAQEAPAADAREALARRADALSTRYSAGHMAALAEHLGFLSELLRGHYPIRPVVDTTELEEIS